MTPLDALLAAHAEALDARAAGCDRTAALVVSLEGRLLSLGRASAYRVAAQEARELAKRVREMAR